MPKNRDMINKEVQELVKKIQSGDNEALNSLYVHVEKYIHSRAWKCLNKYKIDSKQKEDTEKDLYQAGWMGLLTALKNYDPDKGTLFLTYATHFIDREMSKVMRSEIRSSSHEVKKKADYSPGIDIKKIRRLFSDGEGLSVAEAPDRGKYSAVRCALQILRVLFICTDETHSLSKKELNDLLQLYRSAKYDNGTPIEARNTITSILEDILMEFDPLEYTGDNDKDYKIRYEGYKENRLKTKHSGEKGKKAEKITGFSYVHIFDPSEYDRLIQLICFSDMFLNEEKRRLVSKLVSTAGMYYETPFFDGDEIRFISQSIHGRFSTRAMKDKKQFVENINLIKQAMNDLCQIRFKFNCYTAEHTMRPATEYLHILSPYHLVVYHDNYYCIGMKKEDRRIWHYRVDLMSEVEILMDENKKPVPIDLCAFEGLPICNACWDPEKYMAEHLYMAYDEPKEIRIKIRNTGYTILHDWFGDHYEKTDEIIETDENGRGAQYDIVKVRTSPSMIVHWAMQYAGAVEILDEEIREKIRDEIAKLKKKYE